MKKVLIILLGLLTTVVVAIVIIGIMFLLQFNRMIIIKEKINSTWAQVEDHLQTRCAIIPEILKSIQDNTQQEKEIITDILNAQTQLTVAKEISEKIQASKQLDLTLGRLAVIIEKSPELKKNNAIINLMDELASIEKNISTDSFRYNEIVKLYNNTIQNFPGILISSVFGFEKFTYYERTKQQVNI